MTTQAASVHRADLELVNAVLARDRKATARLVEMHADEVHRFVWRRLAPKAELVDDLVQEVFMAAWRAIRTYSGEAPLRAWLLGIARNKVEDHYRKTLSQRLAEIDSEAESVASPEAGIDIEIDSIRQAQRAAEVLEGLPLDCAAVLRWRYWDGRSAREMAAACGRTEKAVERLLARAREKFRARWLEAEGKK